MVVGNGRCLAAVHSGLAGKDSSVVETLGGAPALQAIGVSFAYDGGALALEGVDFVAEIGEFVALLGPNGSGKTTLFRLFGGTLRPNRGRVLVRGQDVGASDRGWLYSTIGFIFQDPNDQLFAATVGEDVAFGPRNLGLAGEEVDRRVADALQVVGMGGTERQPIFALSFGQKRRVAIAGVLAMQPSILVLDEPTAGLDPLGAARILALLRRLNRQQGATVVMATHDVDVVPACADKVYVLRAGQVATVGAPPAVFAQGSLLRACDLRPPRAAQALRLIGQEYGQPLAGLPLTLDETLDTARHNKVTDWASGLPGISTGVAAAVAARAAAELLFQGHILNEVTLRSAAGESITVPVAGLEAPDGRTMATVVKRASAPGDPLDGALICASVSPDTQPGIHIEGGAGVGRVAQAGLPRPVGEAAINPIPLQMIADAVGEVLPEGCGAKVVISVPGGEALAAQTVNAQAGIVGGIAILGAITGNPNQKIQDTEDEHLASVDNTALCFMGHGSRAAEANTAMYQVVELVRRKSGIPIVEVGFMELSPPSIQESVQSCIQQGARSILLVPYFLHMGNHMRHDLPDLMAELRRCNPGVKIEMANHIGFHPMLADILMERIAVALRSPLSGDGG
jgi:cobalt transport protein ATP-binding subunit